MIHRPPLAVACTAWLALAGCTGMSILPPEVPTRPPALVDATRALADAEATALPSDGFAAAELLATPQATFKLIRVHDRVAPHLHDESDETVYVLEGEGDLLLDQEWRPVRAGMLVHVPRGVPHAYVNRAQGGTLVLSVYAPPLQAGDRVLLEEER
jgi:mannose-6-phosphate isomerase-like protein (cupin superfamily)